MTLKTFSVCVLVTDFDAPSGGVQTNSRLLLREYAALGIPTFVCARNYYGLPKNETKSESVIHRSPIVGRGSAINSVIYLLDAFVWLMRNRKKYDVIHCQQLFGPTMVAAVASFFLKRAIVTRVTTVGELGEVRAVKNLPLSSIRRLLIRRVTRWIALTKEMKKEIETLGIPSERITIIYNSTEIPLGAAGDPDSKRAARKELGLGDGRIGVFVGRLSEEKNLDVLIDGWRFVIKKHPDASLLLLGGGGDYRNVEDKLRQMTHRYGLDDAIHFGGHVENAKEYLIASDVFILPTRTEGMSNALVEAFACGATIIATDIPANKEICEDGQNALLVPVGDCKALADAIVTVFESREMSERLGRAAREKAHQELSPQKMVNAYLRLYDEALTSMHK